MRSAVAVFTLILAAGVFADETTGFTPTAAPITEQGMLIRALNEAKASGDQAAIAQAAANLEAYVQPITGYANVQQPLPAGLTTTLQGSGSWFPGDWGGNIQIFGGVSYGVIIDRDSSGNLYAAVQIDSLDGVEIFTSADGGVSWTPTNFGIFLFGATSIDAMAFDVVDGTDTAFAYVYAVFNTNLLYGGRFNLPGLTNGTVLTVDVGSDPKSYVVAGSDVDGWPGDAYPHVVYANNVGGNADSTAIWDRYSLNNGVSWSSATPVASHSIGDWDRVFDWQYGLNPNGLGNMMVALSRMQGADYDVFYVDWSTMPNPAQLTGWADDDRNPNIAAWHIGSDTCGIYITYTRTEGDNKIAGWYSRNPGSGFTWSGVISDSVGVSDDFSDVTADVWANSYFTIAHARYATSWDVHTLWGAFPGPYTNDGKISGINEVTGSAWATIPVHTGWTPSNSYVAWTGFGPTAAYFDWWGNTDAPGGPAALPVTVALHPAAPNPFNPATTLSFDLPSQMNVRLDVFDVLGRKVATLVNGEMGAGSHEVRWDATGVASGVYFARLSTDRGEATTKMTLLR